MSISPRTWLLAGACALPLLGLVDLRAEEPAATQYSSGGQITPPRTTTYSAGQTQVQTQGSAHPPRANRGGRRSGAQFGLGIGIGNLPYNYDPGYGTAPFVPSWSAPGWGGGGNGAYTYPQWADPSLGIAPPHRSRATYELRDQPPGWIDRTTTDVIVQPVTPADSTTSAVERPAAPTSGRSVIPTTAEALPYVTAAEEAFRRRDYGQAARLLEHARLEDAANGHLSLLRSQALLGLGHYEESAAALARALEMLPRDQWGFVIDHYQDFYRGRAYVEQMNQLNQYVATEPKDVDAMTLRGFQYWHLGHTDVAQQAWRKALELAPDHALATKLMDQTDTETLPAPAELPTP